MQTMPISVENTLRGKIGSKIFRFCEQKYRHQARCSILHMWITKSICWF